MGRERYILLRSGNKGLPGETGDSQTDAIGFPDLPSMRIGSQYNAKYAPTSSSDGLYVLVNASSRNKKDILLNTYSKRTTTTINKLEMCSFEFHSTSRQSY